MSLRILTLISACIIIGVFLFIETRSFVEAPTAVCGIEQQLCPDGSYVTRTGPQCAFSPCPTSTTTIPTDESIIINTPTQNQILHSPIQISGKARGTWFFEGSFPVIVTDWDGVIIGQGIGTATGDWMTTDFVAFSGTISYTLPTSTPYARGTVIFKKDNPSGLPEHDASREIPVVFSEFSTPQ